MVILGKVGQGVAAGDEGLIVNQSVGWLLYITSFVYSVVFINDLGSGIWVYSQQVC